MRIYQLGSVLNSTPAVIGSPIRFEQNQLHEHSSFEGTYGSRHTLVWIGTSDGSISGFDLIDGAEILRLKPIITGIPERPRKILQTLFYSAHQRLKNIEQIPV